MADAVIELEARLKNYITGELANVNASLKGTSTATQETAKQTQKLSDYWSKATDSTRILGSSLTKLVGSYIGANAIIGTVRGAISSMNKLMADSVKEYAKFKPDDEHVRKMKEIEDRWRNIRIHIGENIVPATATWRELLVRITEDLTGAGSTGQAAITRAMSTVSGATGTSAVAALQKAYDTAIAEQDKLLQGHYELNAAAEGPAEVWVPGMKLASAAYERTRLKIKELEEALNKAKGAEERENRALRAGPRRAGAAGAAPQSEADRYATQRRIAKQYEAYFQADEDARLADMEARQQRQQEAFDRDVEALAASIDAKLEAEEEYNRACEQLAMERQALADLDVEIAEAKAQSIANTTESMFGSIDSMAMSFIENERDRAYTHAVLGSAQALSNMIALATEDSGSWWEALAKGVASAAEIIALWAPIFSDINSAAYGGQFVTNGPGLLKVGDNPTGHEMVSVTPMGSTNVYGPQNQYDQRRTNETYVFNGVSDDRILAGLRSLKRRGQLLDVMRN